MQYFIKLLCVTGVGRPELKFGAVFGAVNSEFGARKQEIGAIVISDTNIKKKYIYHSEMPTFSDDCQ